MTINLQHRPNEKSSFYKLHIRSIAIVLAIITVVLLAGGLLIKLNLYTAGYALIVILTVGIGILLIRTLRQTRDKFTLTDLIYSQIKYIFDKSNEGICLIDKDYNIVRVNKKFSKLFGVNSCTGKKCYKICGNLLCQTTACPIQKITNGENMVEDLIEIKLPDKSTVVYEITAVPYYDVNGNLSGIFENFRDITERNRAEQLLKEQKDFSENLIQNLTIPTFVLDPDHKVTIWNKACEELTGTNAEEVVGTNTHWKGFYSSEIPCLADVIIKGFKEVSQNYAILNKPDKNTAGFHAEGWLENLNGIKRYVIIETAPITDNEGNLIAVIETVQDITDHKITEERLTKHNKQMHLELVLASRVQQELIPKNLPSVSNVSFAWTFEPSVYVAGDMFNVFFIDESHIGFYILDVKGHGVSAALKAIALSHLLSHTNYSNSLQDHGERSFMLPSKIFKQLNGCCSSYYSDKNFYTIFYGVLNIEDLKLTYARAGHCPPVVLSNNGDIAVLDKGGPAIGLLKGFEYKDTISQLKKGDRVVLYTDGIMESEDMSKNPFLINDLIELIGQYRILPIRNIVDSIVSETKKRTEGLDVKDDITVLGFEIR